jgi:hypothetical protein
MLNRDATGTITVQAGLMPGKTLQILIGIILLLVIQFMFPVVWILLFIRPVFLLLAATNTTPNYTFAPGDPVIIAPAWHSGHNGGVYFMNRQYYSAIFFLWENISNM